MTTAASKASARGAEAPPCLLERGFSASAIEEAGWRVEPIGSRWRLYGLPLQAAEILAWFIPYRHRNGRTAFERIRLLDPADLERFGGGKYRQPAGVAVSLYDPFGALQVEPLDSLLLIEGEANAVAAHVAIPEMPVVGLPGQAALRADLAKQLAHIPVIFVWIDRHDPGAERNAARIAERLTAAGAEEVRLLPATLGMDANDALRELGPEALGALTRELLDQAKPLEPAEDDAWPLIPRPTLPAFPLHALPPAVENFVQALAAATETPPDLGAVAALGVLSVASLGIVVDCGPTWEEELPLYLLVAMESGDRKSSVLGAVAAPLHKLEREAREAAEPRVRAQRLKKDTLEARKTKLVRKIADTADHDQRLELEAELAQIAEDLDELGEPVMPRLLADDATPEQLGGLLAKYRSLAVITAEAPLISNVRGRYDSSGAANLDLVCKAYEGERTQVDRRNREELLERPLLTVTLTVQPHVLRKLVEHDTARQQGLVGRFAFAIPESLLGHRRHRDAEVSSETRTGWEQLVRHVYSRNPLTEPTKTGSVSSVSPQEIEGSRLFLSLPAKRLLYELRVQQEPRLCEGEELRPVADWVARHPGRCARIAALLHLGGPDAPGREVSEDTMRRALEIGEYFLRHSLAALTEPDELVRRALRFLERHDDIQITERELHRGPLGGRGPHERARALASQLVGIEAIRPVAADADCRRPGRPPSPAYKINPRLRATSP